MLGAILLATLGGLIVKIFSIHMRKTESIEVNYGIYNMKDNFKKKRQIMPLIYLIEEKMN